LETLGEVLKYELTRYRHPDQRLVHYLEFRAILKSINLSKGASILDIPCGFGRFSIPLLRMGYRVVAADISHAMVKRTREKVEVTGVVADITSLPFRDRAFDAAVSIRLMQHLDFDVAMRAVSELKRVSKRFVILTFYRENFLHRLERKLTGRKSKIRFFDAGKFIKSAGEIGLELVTSRAPLGPIHAQTVLVFRVKS